MDNLERRLTMSTKKWLVVLLLTNALTGGLIWHKEPVTDFLGILLFGAKGQEEYVVHAGVSVPNYKLTGDKEKDKKIAISYLSRELQWEHLITGPSPIKEKETGFGFKAKIDVKQGQQLVLK